MGMPFGIDPAQNPRPPEMAGPEMAGVVALIGVNAQALCLCAAPLWGQTREYSRKKRLRAL
jgi:hypothetical protein